MSETSPTSEAEVDRMMALARDIFDLLEREPDRVLRLSAIATALKIQAFIISDAEEVVAQGYVKAVGDIASEQLREEWDDLLTIRRRGAN